MESNKLSLAMLHADWRDTMPNWLWCDPREWADGLQHALPPVPLVALTCDGMTCEWADVVATVQDTARIGAAIDARPMSAAILVQCLRAQKMYDRETALLIESMSFAALQGGSEHGSWLDSQGKAQAMAPPGELSLARHEGRLDLRIERSHACNAIDRTMRDALFDAFTLAALDDEITLVRLTATGRCFSVGADLAEFGTTRDPAAAHRIRMRTLPAWPLLRRGARFEVHVQGACIGSGLELAAFADRLTATSNAWFQLPELGMGILPGFGGTVSLTRKMGRQKAAALMLSGRRISAGTALEIGLIDAIVDDPAVDNRRGDEIGG